MNYNELQLAIYETMAPVMMGKFFPPCFTSSQLVSAALRSPEVQAAYEAFYLAFEDEAYRQNSSHYNPYGGKYM